MIWRRSAGCMGCDRLVQPQSAAGCPQIAEADELNRNRVDLDDFDRAGAGSQWGMGRRGGPDVPGAQAACRVSYRTTVWCFRPVSRITHHWMRGWEVSPNLEKSASAAGGFRGQSSLGRPVPAENHSTQSVYDEIKEGWHHGGVPLTPATIAAAKPQRRRQRGSTAAAAAAAAAAGGVVRASPSSNWINNTTLHEIWRRREHSTHRSA